MRSTSTSARSRAATGQFRPRLVCFRCAHGGIPRPEPRRSAPRIEETIFDAARNHPFLARNHPEVVYNGFAAEGYSFKDDKSAAARAALAALDRAHSLVVGKPVKYEAITATTDARFFGLYADTPALVYGPRAEAIHGFNERVDLDSVRRVTQSTALFIAD
ncbi:M20/M25/M40 family metallo-hydrolase [Mesorhizobium sp. C280B]|uniref:M20/M25/M40 family metallo-hydrolase n=1 Tax=unclassified Mesorhizobium TaxID=325217 RepID=UPI001FD91BF1|nr:M20/M25/M40 family metallo-hydrolase [Mesorhizobium sp. LSJC280B00]